MPEKWFINGTTGQKRNGHIQWIIDICFITRTVLLLAREGHDQNFYISYWCIFGANNFFFQISGEGVGAMPYLLTNFWSRDSMYHRFFLNLKTSANFLIFTQYAFISLCWTSITCSQHLTSYLWTMYGRDFSSQSSFPGKKNKNEKALNLSTDFFQLLLPSRKNQSVRRPNSSVDASWRSNTFFWQLTGNVLCHKSSWQT